ncbi:porin [Sneathiella sp. P13V-1]|uniref:porin n=1 Tax=Sneathiella sp. P13V-1 TaxID=2697366 RepID=UPI00187B16F7|nr:porin [Sneathiella sp. P13V-1]MBE7638416.1 porin [Sneathiella sp. P13V-1]
MKKASLIALPLLALALPVVAAEDSYPKISGELSLELENDWTFRSDDNAAELNDLYPTLTLGTTVEFTPELSLNMEATLDPVEDATDDRAFEDLGAYLNIITINYDTDTFGVYAGKFTPNFGLAWDAAPGIFGADLNEDLELAEMIGLGGHINFNVGGMHTVSASTFFADTTFLSDSLGKSRGPLDEDDGGPANTESLSSFALALDGEFEAAEGFRYHLGFTSLAEGDDGDENQYGYVAAVEYEIGLTEEVTLTPIAEYAFLDNAGGIDDADTRYITAGVALGYGNWTVSTAYQNRRADDGTNTVTDYVADFTVGYAFDFGLEMSAAYRRAEEDNIDSQGLGILAAYTIEF